MSKTTMFMLRHFTSMHGLLLHHHVSKHLENQCKCNVSAMSCLDISPEVTFTVLVKVPLSNNC